MSPFKSDRQRQSFFARVVRGIQSGKPQTIAAQHRQLSKQEQELRAELARKEAQLEQERQIARERERIGQLQRDIAAINQAQRVAQFELTKTGKVYKYLKEKTSSPQAKKENKKIIREVRKFFDI